MKWLLCILVLGVMAVGLFLARRPGHRPQADPAEVKKLLQEQAQNREALAELLATFQDVKSIDAGWPELVKQERRWVKLTKQAKDMPRPTAEVLANMEPYRLRIQQATEKIQAETKRIEQVPGGKELFHKLELLRSLSTP